MRISRRTQKQKCENEVRLFNEDTNPKTVVLCASCKIFGERQKSLSLQQKSVVCAKLWLLSLIPMYESKFMKFSSRFWICHNYYHKSSHQPITSTKCPGHSFHLYSFVRLHLRGRLRGALKKGRSFSNFMG